eukprot:UN33142
MDCSGNWSMCTSECERAEDRTFIITRFPTGTGMPCPVSTTDCMMGDGLCVARDCEVSWSPCTAACETSEQRTFTVIECQMGDGSPCEGGSDCAHGDGQCIMNQDCQGSWSQCTAACETAEQRTFTEIQSQSGSGSRCPAGSDCMHGDGRCMVCEAPSRWLSIPNPSK